MNIGNKIKKLRKEQNRTLQEVADQCGFSKSLLCKIEKGVVSPALATLSKLSKTLGVKINYLVEEGNNNSVVFTTAEDRVKEIPVKTDKGYSFYVFAGERSLKKMQPFFMTAKFGEVIEHELNHDGEEFIFMIEGEMKVKVDCVEYHLKSGDSLYFDSVIPHGIMPISETVKYLNVFA
jgi:transcriptional regulator with XRE-family HTH domain